MESNNLKTIPYLKELHDEFYGIIDTSCELKKLGYKRSEEFKNENFKRIFLLINEFYGNLEFGSRSTVGEFLKLYVSLGVSEEDILVELFSYGEFTEICLK